MTQASFFPIVCDRTKPPPRSADADFIAISDATLERYLCKGQSRMRNLPATEWICSSLARDCGVPVPPFHVVELTTSPGQFYFGSQWLDGNVDFTQGLDRVSNPDVFSATLAIDCFAHNVDRHLGGYLYIEDRGFVTARPMDFSRAWCFHGWPLPDLPMASDCNTMTNYPRWMAKHGYARPSAVLAKITTLPDSWMAARIGEMPDSWLTADGRQELTRWWHASKGRPARARQAEAALP